MCPCAELSYTLATLGNYDILGLGAADKHLEAIIYLFPETEYT